MADTGVIETRPAEPTNRFPSGFPALGSVSLFGGTGRTRTYTPISEPAAFKAAAAMPIRLTVPLNVYANYHI